MNAVCEIVPALDRCKTVNAVNLAISDMSIEKIGQLCRRYNCGADDLTAKICDDLHIAHDNGELPQIVKAKIRQIRRVEASWNCPYCGAGGDNDEDDFAHVIDVQCWKCNKKFQVEVDA